MTTTPHLSDSALARQLGITVQELLAQPAASAHRIEGRRGRGAWSPEGVAAVRSALLPGLESAPEPSQPPEKVVAVLTVASRPLPNRRLLACVGAGANALDRSQWILVQVRANENFLAGMQVLAEQVEGASCWRYRGRGDKQEHQIRYPRSRGRW